MTSLQSDHASGTSGSSDDTWTEDFSGTDVEQAMLRKAGLPSHPTPRSPEVQPSTPIELAFRHASFSTPRGSDDDLDSYTPGKRPRRRLGGNNGVSYLPMHRKRRASSATGCSKWLRLPSSRKSRRRCLYALFGILVAALLALWHVLRTYEFQFEMSVYSRAWVKAEFDDIKPLKGCFNSPSPEYNMTRHQAGRHHMLSPGLSLRRGMSCYDFASTVQPVPDEEKNHLMYHTYWRSDLRPFSARQAATLEAFVASQPHGKSKLILWSNGADSLRNNEHIKPYLQDWGSIFEVRQANMTELAMGTEIDGLLNSVGLFDARAWVDGDALRLLVLWHYGGIWMDMDMLLTRDLHLLTESEFVMQWDCYDKPYFQMNGAIMHFMKHSPYLCEAFHVMATSPLPEPNTFTWGSHLYSKLHRRLLAANVQPFAVIPWCFADPRNCRDDIRIPDPFLPDPPIWGGRKWDGRGEVGPSGRDTLDQKISYVWAIHLHNQWEKEFPAGGYIDRLMTGARDKIARLKASARSE